MTICVAIAVPDGIALSADSQTTWQNTITRVREKGTKKEIELEQPIQQPISWSKRVQKLFEFKIKGKSYAICIAGAALLNNKTIYSIFKSFESKYKGENKFDEIVKFLIQELKEEIRKHLKVEELKLAKEIICIDFIIAGYDDEDISRPRIESHSVFSGTHEIEGKENDSGNIIKWETSKEVPFGGCWIGCTEFLSHLIDPNEKLPPIQGQYHLLSLEDAVDYTKFLVNFTCDYQRFAIMVPNCGKPIVSAKLTPNGYQKEEIKEL